VRYCLVVLVLVGLVLVLVVLVGLVVSTRAPRR
jgi:hypothetical protein